MVGLAVVAVIFLGLGGWASIAPLAKAVSAPAVLVVRGERKKIQHLEGGIVNNVHVEEGQTVKKGQLLASLNRCKQERCLQDMIISWIRLTRLKHVCGQNC